MIQLKCGSASKAWASARATPGTSVSSIGRISRPSGWGRSTAVGDDDCSSETGPPRAGYDLNHAAPRPTRPDLLLDAVRGRVWVVVVVALLAAGILARVVPTWAARPARLA